MVDDKRTRKTLAKGGKVVRAFGQRYGPGDRRTLHARTTLAHEYHVAGRTAEGIAMLEQVAADSERLNGPDHKRTLDARMNLASGFREKGDTAEIIPALEQIAADSERIFGPGHEETLTPGLVLALTYRENGRPGEAIPLLEQVIADRERITGLDPKDTVEARLNLALSYLEAGHAGEAVAIFEQVAPEAEPFLRSDQLSTLDRLEMAPLYAAAGRTDEATAVRDQAGGSETGPAHPPEGRQRSASKSRASRRKVKGPLQGMVVLSAFSLLTIGIGLRDPTYGMEFVVVGGILSLICLPLTILLLAVFIRPPQRP